MFPAPSYLPSYLIIYLSTYLSAYLSTCLGVVAYGLTYRHVIRVSYFVFRISCFVFGFVFYILAFEIGTLDLIWFAFVSWVSILMGRRGY